MSKSPSPHGSVADFPASPRAGGTPERPRALGRRVKDELEELILSGAFAPGQRLNEVALDTYEVTLVLFGFAAAQLAATVTAAQALKLRKLVDAMDAAGDRDQYFDMNWRFHALIVGFARNR